MQTRQQLHVTVRHLPEHLAADGDKALQHPLEDELVVGLRVDLQIGRVDGRVLMERARRHLVGESEESQRQCQIVVRARTREDAEQRMPRDADGMSTCMGCGATPRCHLGEVARGGVEHLVLREAVHAGGVHRDA